MAPDSQRFTVHSNVVTHRSEFFRAARRSVWLKDPTAPVDLQDEDPEVFSMYLKCVYFGTEAIRVDFEDEKRAFSSGKEAKQPGPDAFELSITAIDDEQDILGDNAVDDQNGTLVKLYILADKLGDPTTANMVMDELVRFHTEHNRNPIRKIVNLAYESTIHGNPLRKFLRDVYLHVYDSMSYDYFNAVDFPADFYRDLYVEFLRTKEANVDKSVNDVYNLAIADLSDVTGKCRYHQHDDDHPVCTPVRRCVGLKLTVKKTAG
jgi:hypothetical protein